MNTFIKKIILFFVIFVLIISTSIFLINFKLKSSTSFKINKNTHSLILGHSHPEHALNDSLLPGFMNLSKSGETYLYTYKKIELIINENSQIKNIYLEVSNNQIDTIMNKFIHGTNNLLFRYPYYGPFLNTKENMFLLQKNPKGLINAISKSISFNTKYMIRDNRNFVKQIGGYVYSERFKLDYLLKNSSNIKSKEVSRFDYKIAQDNLYYLSKIVEYCNKKKINLIFIRCPQHEYFPLLRNEKIFQTIKDSLYSEIPFLDFNNFPIPNDGFADYDHLNFRGARIFTNWVSKMIKENKLNELEVSTEIRKLNSFSN